MTTNKAISAKAKKIAAYKELLRIAKQEALDKKGQVAPNDQGMVGIVLALDKGWLGPILALDKMRQDMKRQGVKNTHRLENDFWNLQMCNFIKRERDEMGVLIVNNAEKIKQERRVIQLALTAGADPNCQYPYDTFASYAIFDAFIDKHKYHGASLVAQAPGFVGPENQDVFKSLDSYLRNGHKWEFPGKAEMPYARELVYVLFSKGIKPYDPKIRKSLQPIYEAEKKAKANASKLAGNAPQGGRVGASR